MASLKEIRKRIGSVKSTQKITRAMKMVAGARLNRAQQRITAMRPYAVRTGQVLREVVAAAGGAAHHPLLVKREEQRVLLLVVTSDRGLCGSFNSSINKFAEREWHRREAAGQEVRIATIGRKGRDYFRRRGAPLFHVFEGIWDDLGLESARIVARTVLKPYLAGEVDAIYIVYNEFKSAMTQLVVSEPLFPLAPRAGEPGASEGEATEDEVEFIFEPSKGALMERLVPMYIDITVLRALYESMASELGARMTAMDSATKNAGDMIGSLTLKYNRARQAAITTELMEIISGAEALSG
ncbi:MAG: ATP synthase F1 subunit gamma [Polyangiaceae bacterium]|nr:ATP synthase F1 subunit gamma [Polyangiaceae bacterium]MCW5789049.1 ATP synthase F1 subunit gamma [Polyangiaceae bacterium]